MSKILSLTVIEERNNKKKVVFRNRLKHFNFENVIGNELDFHRHSTAKIEIQQKPDDINPFTCDLRGISYGIYNKVTHHSTIRIIFV